MTGIEIAQVISIVVSLIVEKGIPAAVAVLTAWQTQDPTLSDINALHSIVKRPESYFDEPLPVTEPLPDDAPPIPADAPIGG